MSKSFGVLQRLENDKQLSLKVPGCAAHISGNGSRPQPVTGEEVVNLVHSVFRGTDSDAPRVVVFSGVGHGDGCTAICTGAARVLANQFAGSICVVDANLRTPSLHKYFGLENDHGLSEALVQAGPIRSYAHQISGSSIWVLTCGTVPSTPQALFSSRNLEVRVQELRNEFDYVLIDTSPVARYADAATVGGLSDGMILVLQSNTTRREAALRVKESLEAANVRLLGAVLNKRTFPIPERLYRRL